MSKIGVKNIVYKLPMDIEERLSNLSLESGSTNDSPEKNELESQINAILDEHNLKNCKSKLLKPISSKDCEGFIYAYYSNAKPGIFKVGRSKDLPSRRIKDQEKNNSEKYRNKESFHCCFHHLVEACIHLELKDFRIKLEKKQDGYTEWFKIQWEPLRKTILNVIDAVMEIFISGLFRFKEI